MTCAPSGQTTFVAVSYLVMTVLALTCAYVNQGLRRSTGIVIIGILAAIAIPAFLNQKGQS